MNFKKGSILILTLWTLSFLTIFAVGVAFSAGSQLRLASHLQERLKLYYLAKAGIEKGIIELKGDITPKYDSLNERWAKSDEYFKELPLDGGYITFSLTDESSKININKAPVEILKSMLENIAGLDSDTASDIANAIIDWRDLDVFVSSGGAEDIYYEGLKVPYPCKSGEFQRVEELLLVKEMTPEVFSKIRDVITIYGDGKVNINTAPERTFGALGMSSDLAERIIEFRQGKDLLDGTGDDVIFNTVGEIRNIGPLFIKEADEINRLTSLDALSIKSDFYRIESSGILKKGERSLQRNITCVVQRFSKKPAQILYWHED
ncbi:MAG: general secretion pathway protein GspK [Candidatus Omnitrophota bacterium]|nr:MAG: general secretion pathway protein GspK [Candidatus Omnitrophota bacterium]